MIENTTVEGRKAMVAYLKRDFTPADATTAEMVKIVFYDGEVRIAYREKKVRPRIIPRTVKKES